MKPWTQDAAHIAGLALFVVGSLLALNGHPWPGLGVDALGVALLVALRALEYRAEVKDVANLKVAVASLESRLADVTKSADKASEDAKAALGAVRVNTPRPRGLDY